MEKISEALKSTTAKKEGLRQAFDLVKSHSSSLSSFTLQWKDLEQHFDSIQSSLEQRFKHLQTLELQQPLSTIRSELKSFCLKMDGVGLRSFIMDHRKDLPTTRDDVVFGLKLAPDAARLVLDGLQGFYPLKSRRDKSDGELGAIRRTCVLLLEGLSEIGVEVGDAVKAEAKKLAKDWKRKVSVMSDDQLEALVFLQLLGTFGIGDEFVVDEILDLLVSIARRKQAVDLFKVLGLQDKIDDFVEKLNKKGKQIDAIKFVYAFEVVDKFPPVPLLDGYLKESKKIAEEVRKKGNNSSQSQNEAIAKETAYLRAIIKCIEEYKLESQYSRKSIDKRIEELEKKKPEKKPFNASRSQPNQQQNGNSNKRPRIAADVPPMHKTIAPSSQIHHLHPAPLDPYHSSAHYALPQYMNPVASGPSSAIGGTYQTPSLSRLYSSESQLPPSLYDQSLGTTNGYGGGGGGGLLPSYRSSAYY